MTGLLPLYKRSLDWLQSLVLCFTRCCLYTHSLLLPLRICHGHTRRRAQRVMQGRHHVISSMHVVCGKWTRCRGGGRFHWRTPSRRGGNPLTGFRRSLSSRHANLSTPIEAPGGTRHGFEVVEILQRLQRPLNRLHAVGNGEPQDGCAVSSVGGRVRAVGVTI